MSVLETYDYHDGRGHLLFRVERHEPKRFKQCRPGPGGEWVYNLDRVRRVLYRLPQVLAAKKAGEPIYLVEGERDVHTLERFGKVATTVPGGASKWESSFAKTLRGADVVVIGDADRAGLRHVLKVAQALDGVAESLRVFLPDPLKGDDVTDLLEDCRDARDARDRLRACLIAYELRQSKPDNVVSLPQAEPHVVLIDRDTGEIIEPLDCPTCQDLQDQLAGANREVKAWRLRYAKLARDVDGEARESPWWPIAIRLFQYWQEASGHPRAKWLTDRFLLIEPYLKHYGPEVCERAIAGIVYDPFVTTRRNGTKLAHNSWELLFRDSGKVEEYANKAPLDWRSSLNLAAPNYPKDQTPQRLRIAG